MLQSPELRTIFLGMDQSRPELLKSDVKGKNPFKDVRVRKAFYEAIDINAIHSRVMRGQSHPTGLLYGPGVNGYLPQDDVRYPYDPNDAKKLLAEAGYPNGFGITLDCPNDRYVNDAEICQAVTVMLARIGVKATLNARPRMQFFADVNGPGYNTSFYLLGWTPNTYDAHNSLFNLAGTRNGVRGVFNNGGYSNPALDKLITQIGEQLDPAKRQEEITAASRIIHDDVAYIPLHQQTIIWAARKNIELQQLADDSFPLRYVRVTEAK
jgi:peptide/nickel transport system substrate-binding protein